MSGEGPESIPTSADPKSHRPTKRRALTPSTSQSASIDALFARPDQEIRVPTGEPGTGRKSHLPPEIVTNVQGSSAGAGSGEFHVYKASRRREYERLKGMEDEVRKEKAQDEFEKGRAEREKRDEEKTRKNREKRERLKARKSKKGKGGNGDVSAAAGGKTQSNGGSGEARIDHPTTREHDPRDGKGENDCGAKTADADGQASPPQTTGLIIHDED